MKKRPMVLIFAGILSGMAVVWNVMSMTTAFYLLLGSCVIVILIYKDKRYWLMIAGVIIGVIFSLCSKISMNLDLSQAKRYEDRYITGRVLEVNETKKEKQAVRIKNDWLEGEILLYTTKDQKIYPGDILMFQGNLQVFEDATNPGQTSSRQYYFGKGIYYRTYAEKVKIKAHKRAYLEELVLKCRVYLKTQLRKQYSKEVYNFLNAMLLGDKKEIGNEVKDDFRESGLIHLLAVSGLHISLAGRSLYRLMRKICGNFTLSSFIGILSAIFYCILTGMSVSAIRAVIMLEIYFLSEILGEHYDLLSSASFAGIFLLILRPYRIYDTGFLYSFTAVFVIGCYQMIKPKITGRFQKIKESVLFCAFMQIGMFPVMIYFQYEAPVLSFLANVIAIPFATMGFMMAFVMIFFPGMIIHRGIELAIYVVLFISERSYGMLTIGHVPFLWVVLFYTLLFLCLKRKKKMKLYLRVMIGYIGILCLIFIPLGRKKTIAFLDVGQGDCVVADTKEGLIVSDGGSSSVDQVGRYTILPCMKYCGYSKIKIALISHMDLDHYSGILELLEMGKIEYLGLPDIKSDQEMQKIIKIAQEQNTKVFYLSSGRKLTGKDFELEVLHPQKNSELEKNAASLVLQGKMLGHKVLLTGDVEKEGEEELLGKHLEYIDILNPLLAF